MFMVYWLIFMGLLFLGVHLLNKSERKSMKAQGLISQALGLTHIGGVPMLKEGTECVIGEKEDRLVINKTHILSLSQIKRLQVLKEEQLVEKEKSVIKRAVVGGLLLGPVAAIVGGISGVGTKKTKDKQNFLSIDYKDKNGQEFSAVFHINDVHVIRAIKFANDINEKIGFKPEEVIAPNANSPYEI